MGPLASRGKRFMAALIDGVLGWAVSTVPYVGVFVALLYAFTKDAWPILDGQSVGKRAMSIRVVKERTGESLTGDYLASVIRQVSLFIPLFNLVDACMVFSAGRRRFGDRWAGTTVLEAPSR
jgi:uncharacterized RDD family membrane protein YckC